MQYIKERASSRNFVSVKYPIPNIQYTALKPNTSSSHNIMEELPPNDIKYQNAGFERQNHHSESLPIFFNTKTETLSCVYGKWLQFTNTIVLVKTKR